MRMFAGLMFVLFAGTASSVAAGADYLGETPPADTPVIFAPGVVSVEGRFEYGLAISPAGDELFFTAENPRGTEREGPTGLLVMRRSGDGSWSDPIKANLRGDGSWEQEAFYTVDGEELYFCSKVAEMQYKLWSTTRTPDGWAAPALLDSPANDADIVFYATFTRDGTMYYTSVKERMVRRAMRVDGGYPEIEDVAVPGGHAFAAPDGSFLLLDGKRDLWVAFSDGSGGWMEPVGLGETICSESTETCPSLSPDGKYIFFSRYNEPGEIANIYWVSSDILGRLKPEKNK